MRSLGRNTGKALALCGGKSGREVDKVREAASPSRRRSAARPILSRLSWCWSAASGTFVSPWIRTDPRGCEEKWYPGQDYHIM